ncbi:hypothetical protein AB0A60_32975 [Streptomyces sp. NPDC046275]|uniref:hypothetical protein n=1 Tax=Streptomyces sp. NPDC046275 TaxID=3157201 RepID=UPI0033D96484
MENAVYQRVRARVVRAGPYRAHVAVESFASGQITVPVPTLTLLEATGLSRRQLADAVLTVTVNIAALEDTDVCPFDWQLIAGMHHPATRRSALSDAA